MLSILAPATEPGVDTAAFGLREVRRIYKKEEIRIDHWPLPRKIKALHMCDDGYYCSVALQQKIPEQPKLFALIHELKHHYCDRAALGSGVIHCGDYDRNELIEKGAEVFAAEFIYPEAEFADDFSSIVAVTPQPLILWSSSAPIKPESAIVSSVNVLNGSGLSVPDRLTPSTFRSWKIRSTVCRSIGVAVVEGYR